METSKQEWVQFEREWTRAMVASINMIRDAAGLTVKDLAQRLRHLGWPISDATLSGMLSGDKRTSISIAEAAAFARALNVSPLYITLGLPQRNKLPSGKLWGESTPFVDRVADWFSNGSVLEPYPGDKIRSKSVENPAYVAHTITRQGLRDVHDYAGMMNVIRWQAAQLVAFSTFDQTEIQESMPKEIWNQEYLWDAINRLSYARSAQRDLGDEWGIPLIELPEVLQFVDEVPLVQREDFSVEELAGLASPEDVKTAMQNTRRIIESVREAKPHAKREGDGSPA